MVITSGSTVFDARGQSLTVGDYIGHGGCGIVYKVKTQPGEQPLALKTLIIPFSAGSTDLLVLLNEGGQAPKIRHRNVIRYELFHDGSRFPGLPPYILMEFADGGTLADMLDQAKQDANPFSHETLMDMFGQLIEGMDAINAVLVHRDIKPENILLSVGTLKITDFGLAKLAQEATRRNTFKGSGTFEYMAPEAWKNDKNTIQLDIYAMGIVFYELATLKHPLNVQTDDAQNWREAHLFQPVEFPHKINGSIPLGVSQMIMKMIEKNASLRAKDWKEVRELMGRTTTAGTTANPIIAGMMKKRLEADSASASAKLAKEKEQQSEREFGRIVVSQARNLIIQPLQKFFQEFNDGYAGKGIDAVLQDLDFSLALSITLPNGTAGKIEFRALMESQFWRDQQFNDYGHTITRRVLAVPMLKGKKVQGFGLIQLANGQGFNLALVENPGEIYGDWFMLINRSSPLFGGRRRVEPFPFGFNEMEKELHLVDVVHVHVTDLQPLDISYIQNFFAEAGA